MTPLEEPRTVPSLQRRLLSDSSVYGLGGVANQALSHPVMRRQLERLRTRLIEGGLMRTLIDEVSSLPVATRRLLIAAERSGDLENAFHTLAGDMSDEVERSSARL